MRLKDILRRMAPGRIPEPTPEAVRAVIRRIVDRCPVCEMNLDGHQWAEMATVFATDPVAESELRHAIAAADWEQVLRVHQWDPEADVLEWDAIRCSRRNELGVVLIRYTAEMWSDDRREDAWRLNAAESQRVSNLIGDRWDSL